MIRSYRRFLSVALICIGFYGSGQAAPITFSTFTNPHPVMGPGTIGFTYAGNKFVGTVLQNGTGSLYSTDLSGGNVQVFAPTVSLSSTTQEHYIAASFGLGGFPNGDIYAANSNGITHITNNGLSSNSFVTGLSGDVRGITFDTIGSFGGDMLVTTDAGNVYRVTSGGSAGLLANVGEPVEGLDVAPLGNNFSTFDGQLIVASEGSGMLRAVSSGGVVTVLANTGSTGGPVIVPSAEELTFVPLNLGASGSPLEGLYSANYTPDVQFAAGSQFNGRQGHIIVTSESGLSIGQVHDVAWNGSQFVVTQVGMLPNQPEDGIFITPKMVQAPEPGTLSLIAAGTAIVALGSYWRRRKAALFRAIVH
jgi:hypothetical protein